MCSVGGGGREATAKSTAESKTAATADPYADAAVGNVTGSNSVNVFLGLGLPWAVAAIYWKYAPDARRDEWRARAADLAASAVGRGV